MATVTKRKTGWQVVCPYCSDEDSTLQLDLNKLDEIVCTACSTEFSPAEAVAKLTQQLERWRALRDWAESAAEAD